MIKFLIQNSLIRLREVNKILMQNYLQSMWGKDVKLKVKPIKIK